MTCCPYSTTTLTLNMCESHILKSEGSAADICAADICQLWVKSSEPLVHSRSLVARAAVVEGVGLAVLDGLEPQHGDVGEELLARRMHAPCLGGLALF